MSESPLAFVTVVYEPELPLLHLQARSFARFAPPELVGSVAVIDNSSRGLGPAERDRVVGQFGPHADSVRILRPSDVADLPRTTGWYGQQVLKLEVARLLDEPLYVVLDAKNHLMAPISHDTFVGPRGLPRANTYGYHDHPLRPALERTLGHLGIEPSDHLGSFTATVTPFVLDTAVVRALVEDVATRAGRPFSQVLVGERLTEFFLYTGWQLARGGSVETAFDVPLGPVATLWPRAAARDARGAVEDVADRVRHEGVTCAAVHLRAFEHLDSGSVEVLVGLWFTRGLIPSRVEGEALCAEVVRLRRATPVRRRLDETVAKVLTRLRG